MATNLTALKAAIKLVADGVNDALTQGKNISGYANLLADVMTLMPQVGDIPTEASALAPADYADLIATLAADLAIPDAHAASVLNASVKLISDIATVVVPDAEALIAAIKAAPAAAPATT